MPTTLNGGNRMPRALITGITGQDGLYLGELLAAKADDEFRLATSHQL